jgi:hypothetical protein
MSMKSAEPGELDDVVDPLVDLLAVSPIAVAPTRMLRRPDSSGRSAADTPSSTGVAEV